MKFAVALLIAAVQAVKIRQPGANGRDPGDPNHTVELSPDQIFSTLDANGDGAITAAEAAKYAPILCKRMNEPNIPECTGKVNEVFKAADADLDGKVSRGQFMSTMEKL